MSTETTYHLDKLMNAKEAIGYLAQQLGINNDQPPYYVVQQIMEKVKASEDIIGALYEAYSPLDEALKKYESKGK